MKRSLTLLLCVILILVSLSGCSLSFNSQDLMVPPKPTGDEAQIQKIIEKQSGKEYELLLPSSGDNKTAIISKDVDLDGNVESLAIYRANGETHLLFLDKDGNSYKALLDMTTEAKNVDRVDFADVDGDDVLEILIGLDTGTGINNLSVYKFTDTVVEIPTECPYTTYVTGDFSDNGRDEILSLIITPDASNSANLISHDGSSLSSLSSCDVDNSVSSIEIAKFGNIGNGIYGAFIDALDSSEKYMSMLIYYDNNTNELLNPLYGNGEYDTRRNIAIFCRDVNDDGMIDIPVAVNNSDDESGSSYIQQISWIDYDIPSHEFINIESDIYAVQDSYLFRLPSNWAGAVRTDYDTGTRELIIYQYDYQSGSSDTPLLCIRTYTKENMNQNTDPYRELFRSDDYLYAFYIPENDSYMAITEDEVLSNFSVS